MSSKFVEYLGYEIDDEPSDLDEEESLSSSDEIEKDYERFLKDKRSKPKTKEAKLADEFEQEMNQQLDTIVNKQENNTAVEASASKIMYEEEEDTDSEEEMRTGKRCTKKKQKFSNDDLFYDPDMDDEDENWINKQRQTSKKVVSPEKKVKKESDSTEAKTTESETPKVSFISANSDAVLNCPCCMVNVCYDCQRHEKFKTQYRAMFVFNCQVNQEDVLKYPKNELDKKKFNRKKSKLNKMIESVADIEINELTDESEKYDLYRPVNCSNCNTEIGVYEEKEEIYHFFNVLASY